MYFCLVCALVFIPESHGVAPDCLTGYNVFSVGCLLRTVTDSLEMGSVVEQI